MILETTKNISEYWDDRYQRKDIGWDLGEVSPPLKKFIDQLQDTSQHILIPGAGNAYEAEYLFSQGFRNVYVLDIAETALQYFRRRCPWFPESQLLHQNFFDLQMKFDLVLEQTFFCALNPNLRSEYALKMSQILPREKSLVGLLFDFPLSEKGPPYGGSKQEYLSYFEPYFIIETFEREEFSHVTREGKELFIKLKRK